MSRAEPPLLYTLGYEGVDIADFIAALRSAGVRLVLDVRAVPYSRKADFVKARLGRHLEAAGIGYRHLGGLGNPKPGREAAAAGETAAYHHILSQHLASGAAQADLAEAATLAGAGGACLVCLEADASRCHRSLVAERLAAEHGFTVCHLRHDGQQRLDL